LVKSTGKTNIMQFIRKLVRNTDGATAIEYGLIAALIAVAAITAMQGMGNQLQTTFNSSSSGMAAGNP
jgi:pilus assembly protein Flp/PilA